MTDFNNSNAALILSQAIKIAGFDAVRSAALTAVAASPGFTSEQKLAIKIAGGQLVYHAPFGAPQVLSDIMDMAWEDVSAGGVEALTIEQREGIIQGIMAVCKGIIAAEATRLNDLTQLETPVPEAAIEAE